MLTAITEMLEALTDQIKERHRALPIGLDLDLLSRLTGITDALHDLIRTQDHPR